MKKIRPRVIAAAIMAIAVLGAVQTHAGLFKLDFSPSQNRAENVTLTDWDTLSDWSFTDFPDGIATWKLTDFSAEKNSNVTLTIRDNAPLAAQFGAPAIGMASFNPDPQGLDAVYDGIRVPAVVKDDYLFRDPDMAGTELLFRLANLTPGRYHVTLFNDRVNDPSGQYGKLWIDDIDGKNEPAAENTGDYAANPLSDPNDPNSPRVRIPLGHPQTLVVDIKAGDFLWFAHMEDAIGGVSGMIVRSWVDSDGDGIPDDWEIQWGLNPQDPNDAAKDINGNGLSNWVEYQSALDPTDTTRPTIRSAVANSLVNQVVVTFSKPIFSGSSIPNDPRDATAATNLANYSISPALAITGVAVKGNVVTLATAQSPPGGAAYTLTVNNVRDVNNWPVVPNSTVTFSMGATPAIAQPLVYQWMTIAGKAGSKGSADGSNSAIRLSGPTGVAVDSKHQVFVSDGLNATIRKLVPDGTNWVSATIVGKPGVYGSADGTDSDARFGYSATLGAMGRSAVDSGGNVFVGDFANHTIRKITPQGTHWVVSTIAGKAASPGSADGTNSNARFNLPDAVSLDTEGNLYVLDCNNSTIRKLTPSGTDWVVSTIVGAAGHPGSADGTNKLARFNFQGNGFLTVDNGGNIFVTDYGNQTIRKIVPQGTNWVTATIAGKVGINGTANGTNSSARFSGPNGITVDGQGNLYVADWLSNTIRKLTREGTNWVVTTIGGRAAYSGSADGIGSIARFNQAVDIAVDPAGSLYVADFSNNTIRMGVPLPVFLSVSPVNGRIELIVNTAPGQKVQLQYNPDLSSANWTSLGNPITATSGLISATDAPAPGQSRFYRALVVVP